VKQLKEVQAQISGSEPSKNSDRRTIFHELLTPKPEVDYVVPPIHYLKDEVVSILAAASDTTGNSMTVAAYNVIKNPAIYQKLVAELKEAFPDPNARLEFTKLERLPYLVSSQPCLLIVTIYMCRSLT
jgi:hypothetical protein